MRVGQALDVRNRPFQVGHGLRVRHSKHRLEDTVHIARIWRALARVHIRRHGDIPLFGKAPRHLLNVLDQPKRFHNDHDARVAARSRRTAEIGVDLRAILTRIWDHTRLDLWWIHNVLLASWGQLGYPMPAGYPLHRRMSTQVTGTIDGQVMHHLSHSVIPIMPPYPTHIPIQLSNCSTAKTGETSRISQQLTMSPSDPAQARMIRLVLSCGEEAVAITPVFCALSGSAAARAAPWAGGRVCGILPREATAGSRRLRTRLPCHTPPGASR